MPARHNLRTQSAMEYLMTYGWAILIIAVVLGALYSLGVFNTASLQPKVPGGGCHVFRPNGPGTSWNVNLVGSCNNALPQYVAAPGSSSAYITTTSIRPMTPFTLTEWYYPYRKGASDTSLAGCGLNGDGTSWGWDGCTCNWISNSINVNCNNWARVSNLPIKTWQFIALTMSPTGDINTYVFAGGASYAGASSAGAGITTISGPVNIGCWTPNYLTLNGSIANVQIYNTSLTANQVKYLYNEGIGGVPISPQYLVGWWPLNGDTKDYSGNSNDGVPTNILYNGSWSSGYYH